MPRCLATTSSGQQCKNNGQYGGFCHVHAGVQNDGTEQNNQKNHNNNNRNCKARFTREIRVYPENIVDEKNDEPEFPRLSELLDLIATEARVSVRFSLDEFPETQLLLLVLSSQYGLLLLPKDPISSKEMELLAFYVRQFMKKLRLDKRVVVTKPPPPDPQQCDWLVTVANDFHRLKHMSWLDLSRLPHTLSE
jgi:hypothetical protein